MLKRILLSLPLWLAYSATAIVLDAVGLVLIPLLILFRQFQVRPSTVWPRPVRIGGTTKGGLIVAWKPRWAWVWGNEEDGVVGPSWFHDKNKGWSGRRLAFVWSAIRNPSNNLRFVPGINPVIDPKRVRYYDSTVRSHGDGIYQGARYVWQGLFSGLLVTLLVRGATYRFWIGWKLKPEDARGVADTDMRKPRCGFAHQLKRIS